MLVTAPRQMDLDDAVRVIGSGGAFVDLRPVDAYLDVHIHGALCLLYEWGPGMPSRARDCIPLETPLVLLDEAPGTVDMGHVAASLRGKGFDVAGVLAGGTRAWGERYGTPASTDVELGPVPPEGTHLDVGDPGAEPAEDGLHIPIERLWARRWELPRGDRLVIVAGAGVRAALAVGMLERARFDDIVFWKSRARTRA